VSSCSISPAMALFLERRHLVPLCCLRWR
jgi:hypothetical protein